MADNLTDFRHIFVHDVPMMDVRAPVEFGQGAFPGVVNHPLMNDDEREQVGTCYKQKGQDAAIALGHQLVSGANKQRRVEAWAAFAQAQPQGVLYCFRGGLRSQIVQQWLHSEAGISYPRVVGGYKAMRTFLIETTQAAATQCGFYVLSGLTGTGKTEVLAALSNGGDLEAHANQRGSSFGTRIGGQPTQIDFENRLAIDFLKKRAQNQTVFVVEDEGRHVGRCAVPLTLRQRLEKVPLVCLDDSFEDRVERILRDYVVQQRADCVAALGEADGAAVYFSKLLESLDKLSKRLGGDRHQVLRATMVKALEQQQTHGDVALHRDWIAVLMRDYYDPMYLYQRQSRTDRIVFQGDKPAVLAYLRERAATSSI